MIRVAAFFTARTAFTARTTVPTATATVAITARAAITATVAAITAITPVAARFARFTGRTGVFHLSTGFLIDDAHRQADLAAVVDLEDLDLDLLAFLDDVGRLLDALVAHFRDVDEAVLLADRIVMMTNGPAATIGEVLTVGLERPRDRIALVSHPDYVRAREGVLRFLYERHRFVEAAE